MIRAVRASVSAVLNDVAERIAMNLCVTWKEPDTVVRHASRPNLNGRTFFPEK
jgi:hypothetical protein